MGARNIDFLKTNGIEFIYHMTHVSNITNILKYGLQGHGNSFQQTDISNGEVNSRRTRREPVYGKRIHDYVPFYFSPRNPMLFVQEHEDDIVILVFPASMMYEDGMLFTDGNASSGDTGFSNDMDDLGKLNWNCIHAKYWNDYLDGKRIKMAEVLLPRKVIKSNISAILCKNNDTRRKVDVMTKKTIDCFVDHKFYF